MELDTLLIYEYTEFFEKFSVFPKQIYYQKLKEGRE